MAVKLILALLLVGVAANADSDPQFGYPYTYGLPYGHGYGYARGPIVRPGLGGAAFDGAFGGHAGGGVSSVSRSPQGIGKRSAEADPDAEPWHPYYAPYFGYAPFYHAGVSHSFQHVSTPAATYGISQFHGKKKRSAGADPDPWSGYRYAYGYPYAYGYRGAHSHQHVSTPFATYGISQIHG
jgi:hypothetical protein